MTDYIDKFLALFSKSNTMEMLLFLMIATIIIVMVKMTRNVDDTFDLKDLVSKNDKLDEKKFTRFGAWVISTWGFIYILVNNPNTFPEWYFIGYMAVWVSNVIADKWVNKE